MEIFSKRTKAYECAIRRFLRQKSNDPVYICRAVVARKEFWTVLSSAELKANKISADSCWTAFAGQHGLLEHKQQRQSRENDEYRLKTTACRGYHQYIKATEKLKEMERGAAAPKRPTKLATTEA